MKKTNFKTGELYWWGKHIGMVYLENPFVVREQPCFCWIRDVAFMVISAQEHYEIDNGVLLQILLVEKVCWVICHTGTLSVSPNEVFLLSEKLGRKYAK